MPDVTYRISTIPLPGDQCWGTPQQMLDLFAQHMFVNFSNSASFFSIGSTTPTPDKRTSPWFKLDSSGRPVGWYFFYNGNWRRAYSAGLNDIALYSGPTTNIFDSTGKGLPGTDQDGWCLCNGQNGTPDLRDRFIIGAQTYDGGAWKSSVEGALKVQGGEALHKITLAELPPIWTTDTGDSHQAEPTALLDKTVSNATSRRSTAQTELPPPPYYALALKTFKGYE